jgi:glyoxylase-like metal-dependent hydrolase (beta-lactamase superfamily II)
MLNLPQAPEVTADALVDAIDAREVLQILDVRAPSRVSAGRIDLVPANRFHNVVGSSLIKVTNAADVGIDPSIPVTVVCGRGNDSRVLALHLNHLGFEARSLTGGMSAWMSLAVPHELPLPASLDRFMQFDRIGKGALGYLLVSNGEAIVVDPPRNVEPYMLMVEDLEAKVVAVADTHVHADYISGAPALASYLRVPYYLQPMDSFYPYDGTPGRLDFQPTNDGDRIEFGRSALKVMHTPGHTEGSLTYVVDDSVALTGDFLFVNSIGRPDLANRSGEWAEQLWDSVESAKRQWSPDMTILPAHYADDSERVESRLVCSEFGRMLNHNESLQFNDRSAFLEWIESRKAPFPEVYRRIKAVNVGLVTVTDADAEVLEVGRNECALGGAR